MNIEIEEKLNELQKEIDKKMPEIKAESYPMSIGELASLYQGATNNNVSEIDLHPEFQRFFQWTSTQKTKLIESILLGIPIPPIFVAQKDDGIWEVIDGTQRLSTIFQFMGILKDENNHIVSPLVLESTQYLPSLMNKKWHDVDNELESLTNAQRLYIKRAKLDLKIILRGSDKNIKYEMFNRLNTGGTKASPQDVRNCLLTMENKNAFEHIKSMVEFEPFEKTINLTQKDKDERYDMELVLRFLILRNLSTEELNYLKNTDVNNFLTDKMLEMIQVNENNLKYWSDEKWKKEKGIFEQVFQKLYDILDDNAFKKYDVSKDKYVGTFYIYAFEVIAIGLGYNIDTIEKQDILSKIKDFSTNEKELSKMWKGLSGVTRIPKTIGYGRTLFKV